MKTCIIIDKASLDEMAVPGKEINTIKEKLEKQKRRPGGNRL